MPFVGSFLIYEPRFQENNLLAFADSFDFKFFDVLARKTDKYGGFRQLLPHPARLALSYRWSI